MELFFVGMFGGAILVGTAWALYETFRPRRRSWMHPVIYRKGQEPESV